MKTRFPSVYVDYLGRQLRLWEKYGISDSRAMKLLRLWTGYNLTQYMDRVGRYTFHSFNHLRVALGFTSMPDMLDTIRKSQSFILLGCDIDVTLLNEHTLFTPSRPNRDNYGGMTAFYSPVWKRWDQSDGIPLSGSMSRCQESDCESQKISQKIGQNPDGIDNNNILDNNIPPVGRAGALDADESASGLSVEDIEEINRQEMAQQERDVRQYFRQLAQSEDPLQHQPIELLSWRLQQPENPPRGKAKGYGLTADQALEVIEILIDYELAPYFVRNRSFMSPRNVEHPERRIYQVTNFVKGYCSDKLKRSYTRWKRRAAERERRSALRQEDAIRRNRPLSPYEWMDPEGVRWMDDSHGNEMRIEPEAPPRPSADAVWNYVSDSWC